MLVVIPVTLRVTDYIIPLNPHPKYSNRDRNMSNFQTHNIMQYAQVWGSRGKHAEIMG